MSKSPTIPLHLCQVLEEEYEQIVGQPLTTHSWNFRSRHLKTSGQAPVEPHKAFIERLQNSPDRLSWEIKIRFLAFLHTSHRLAGGHVNDLTTLNLSQRVLFEFLNEQLGRDDLYSDERFEHVALSKMMLKLVNLGTRQRSHGDRDRNCTTFEGQDRRLFNRLLLEEAYPDYIRRINEIRLARIYSRIRKRENSALCLSGGGIRSGTFSLGIIQGLARHGLLDKFDYLSTVSGGGYIGSWLSAWLYRHPEKLNGVNKDLKNDKPASKLQPEPQPIRYLRDYSHFLTPRYSLLSADVWSFVAIYLRNLLLNWVVLIPLLICVLTIPKILLSVMLHKPSTSDPFTLFRIWTFLTPNPHTLFFLSALLAAFSIGYIGINRPSMSDALYANNRFWRRHTGQTSFIISCLLPLSLSAIMVLITWAWTAPSSEASVRLWMSPLISKWSDLFNLLHGFSWFQRLNWLPGFRWAYLFTLAAYLLGTFFVAIILHRNQFGLALFSALVTAPISALFLWLVTVEIFDYPLRSEWIECFYVVFGFPLYLLVWLLSITIIVGLTSRNYTYRETLRSLLPMDEDQEWYARLDGWLLIATIVWTLLSSLVIFGPHLLKYLWEQAPTFTLLGGGGSGIFAALGGHSSKTPATPEKAAQEAASKKSIPSAVWSFVTPYILTLASLVFIMFLIATLSLLTNIILSRWVANGVVDYVQIGYIVQNAPRGAPLVVLLVSLVCSLFMAWLINLSKFSLHAGYRTRLIRTYLGASRSKADRKPNRFTGFDPADNIQMRALRPGLFHERDFKNLPVFVKRLRDPQANCPLDEVDNYTLLKSMLSAETRNLLENHDDTNPPSPSLKASLIISLNSILEDKDLSSAFSGASDYNAPSLAGLQPIRSLQGIISDLGQRLRRPQSSRQAKPGIAKNRTIFDEIFSDQIDPYEPGPSMLFHVLNITLNLFHGQNLAWQQRKAASFTTSALHSGSFHLGYRETKDYGGPEGLSLGTAATTSGAAVNSNMGYFFSSALVSFVLTFFNARLGLWLGNPGVDGNRTHRLAYPNISVLPILSEAFGYTDDTSGFVNLSDGGHFENLALYEMVLRRCHFMIVVDGGEDPECKFDDLGNAVRKIRIDLGIPIEFEHVPIYPRDHPQGKDGTYWAVGRVKYSCVDGNPQAKDGLLVYIKPAFYGNEPSDIYNYAVTHKTFPHQTTANQFFDESQFESYRMLGSYIVDSICGDDPTVSIRDFARSASDQLKGKKSSQEFEDWIKKWLEP